MASSYSLSHLSDQTLLRDLATLVVRDRATTAALLAHLAEVDDRKLYVPAGHPSMFAYCVDELRLSEEAARKRIHAARTARRVPALFAAVADGRLHLSAVILLAPYLGQENANELLAAATHKSKFEIERLIAERFPRLDVPVLVEAIAEQSTPPTLPTDERAPGRVDGLPTKSVEQRAPGRVESPIARSKVVPLGPGRYAVQFTMSQTTHDKLRQAQDLLSHTVPSGDVGAVFDRALDALIRQLERTKFAATDRPRRSLRHPAASGRHIPAAVKHAVWERDGGRCTFVSEAGRRCPARRLLEFDHVDPVARGGQATVEGMRLRCRAHNQYAAECAFGAEFMSRKRQEAQRTAEHRRVSTAERGRVSTAERGRVSTAERGRVSTAERERAAREEHAQVAAKQSNERDVVPWLRALGFRADEARRAATLCEERRPDALLEERVRRALSYLAPPARTIRAHTTTPVAG